MLLTCWLIPLLLWLFVLGAAVGSFLNVVIARLPGGRSLTWPGSRCGQCLRPVRLEHNIPLVSYWWLRGRCRDCGTPFSMRYFGVELGTGLAFVTVYLVEVGFNWPRYPVWPQGGFWYLEWGQFPPGSWPLFAARAVLAALVIAAVGCGAESGRVPRGLVATGVLTGIAVGVLLPWPWPASPGAAVVEVVPAAGVVGPPHRERLLAPSEGPMPAGESWASGRLSPYPGLAPWPAWGPLPAWLPPGSWGLGLVTALAGVLAGGWLGELLDALAQNRSGRRDGYRSRRLGQDVFRIGGAFLGWQVVLAATLLAAVAMSVTGKRGARHARGLEPGGAILAAWLLWPAIGPPLRPMLFRPAAVAAVIAGLAAGAWWLNRKRSLVPLDGASVEAAVGAPIGGAAEVGAPGNGRGAG